MSDDDELLAIELERIATEIGRGRACRSHIFTKYDPGHLRDAARRIRNARTPGPATVAMVAWCKDGGAEITREEFTGLIAAFLAEHEPAKAGQ